MPSVACAGSVSGSTTLKKVLKREALSSIAASSRSIGTALKYCVIRKTPNGAASPGSASPA